jgi:hypothetical protein
VLDSLPPLASIGIGSLPSGALEDALALSLSCDVPWLPEVVRRPEDSMVPAALRGLPGFDGAGDPLGEGWRPFLEQVERQRPRVAKVQLAGPATALRFGRVVGGAPLAEFPEVAALVPAHLASKAARMARELAALGAEPLVFLDEVVFEGGALAQAQRSAVVEAARAAGAVVGVHCCAQAPWAVVLEAGFDVISLDARLSLEALVETGRSWRAFLARGGRLCLGVIPTDVGAAYRLEALCEGIEASLRATTPNPREVLRRALLSPACGLALHPRASAARIFGELREAQALLRAVP